MKRGAERQISKDDFDKDEEQACNLPYNQNVSDALLQDDSPQVGFQKADNSVLATRP
jgi:hypothetical protein